MVSPLEGITTCRSGDCALSLNPNQPYTPMKKHRILLQVAFLACCGLGQVQAQTLPPTLSGTYTVDLADGPIIGGNSVIDPAGVTVEFGPGGAFVVNVASLQVEYLVVGGGGGGGTSTAFGNAGGSGGGAGGVVAGLTTLGTGSVDVIVGIGGSPGPMGNNNGANGVNSVFDNIVALGGGGGGGGNNPGNAGGSGGGSRTQLPGGAGLQPGSASGGFGNPGGGNAGDPGGGGSGGGGGGAGAAGGNVSTDPNVGANGGNGLQSGISGINTFYGGGGGAGGAQTRAFGTGGNGGGGNGGNSITAPTAGVNGTGGGGGGGNNDVQGAPGGDGVVIIRYSGAQAASGGTVTTVGGDTVHTFTPADAGNPDITFTGDISGSGSFTFNAPGGRLTLSGNNSYSGGTIIEQGTLRLGSGTALGASGSSVLISPAGTLDINGVNTNASGLYDVTVNGGTITSTAGNQFNALRFVTVTADSTFTGTNRWDLRGGGGLLDLGGNAVTKTGDNKIAIVDSTITAGTINVQAGEFGLTRSNWTGGTANVNGGSLWFENNSVGNHVYDVEINLNGANLRSSGGNTTTVGGLLTLTGTQAQNTIQVDNNTFSLAGGISGSGGFTKTGGGILLLPTANSYTGGTIIEQGTLRLGNGTALGPSGSSVLINPAGTLDINGVNTNASGLYNVTVAGGTITSTAGNQQNALRFVTVTADSTFTGTNRWDLRGGGGLLDLGGNAVTKTGGNKIAIVDSTITAGTINVQSGQFALTRSSWNSGTVNVNGGSLWFENNSIGNHAYGMAINLNGANLRSSGGNTTTAGGPLTLTGSQAQNTIQVDNNNFVLAGGISGSGGFTKTGGGTLRLPTANTYSGTSNLIGGAVEVGHNQAFGSGTLDLRGSAIRSTDATDRTIGNFVSLSSNTTFGSAGTGNLTFTGDMNKGGLPKTINIQNEVTTFTGTITGGGTGEMTKTGPGRAVFDGNATYPGATNVVEGTLEINGTVTNSPVTVLSNGRLSGSGTINTSLNVDGGTLAPGSADLFGLGTLTVNGDVAFASTWEVSFLGPDASLLDHSGDFNANLQDITLAAGDTFSPQTFVPYLIYQGDSQAPLQGLFENFTPGGTVGFPTATGSGEINDTLFAAFINSTLDGQGNLVSGNGIVLYAIPEPGRALLLAVAAFGLLLRRRRG